MTDFDVLLSHNSEDQPAVRELGEALRERDLRVWLDEWELVPGRPWQEALEKILAEVRSVAVLVGKDGLGPWEIPEMRAALSQAVRRDLPVIPVLLPGASRKPDLPLFLELFTWVDLRAGIDAPGLDRLEWGITGRKPGAPQPGAPQPGAPQPGAPQPDVASKKVASGPHVAIDRLPRSGELFVARDDELRRLDEAWAADATHAISIVAWGGVGKSALVNRWLAKLAADDWRGAARVYGWSFYSQGTEERLTSADAFIADALAAFGDPDPTAGSPRDRGLRLAELVSRQRTLLVLDGVEPLQHPPGPLAGRLKDPALAALVKSLAAKNAGLCVITTREPVDELAAFAADTAPRLDLEALGVEGGAELLRQLGVAGAVRDRRQAAVELGGHALALTLLGNYLTRALGGDGKRWREVPLGEADERQGGHAYRVMAAYVSWFEEEGMATELAILHLLGFFDRPAEAAAVAALRAAPAVADLNDGLVDLTEEDWQWALSHLREVGLFAEADTGAPRTDGKLDAHPLVRSYFGDRLRAGRPEAWRAGHERLYGYYRGAAPELPDTVDEMLPLWSAVVHGCRAGKHQEAYDEVYKRRIRRGDEHYQLKKLGAFGADLVAVAAFFARPWREPLPIQPEGEQAWLLAMAGFELRALGRLAEAVEPMRAAMEFDLAGMDWKNAAVQAGNLSQLHLTLGDVARAVASAEESVELADRSGDAFQRMADRTTLADALHQAGRLDDSAAAFREAEALQAERQPQTPRLYSLWGYRNCDLLLSAAGGGGAGPGEGSGLQGRPADPSAPRQACREVLERAEQAIKIAERNRWILDIALDHLSLGRARFGLALADPAGAEHAAHLAASAEALDRAVAGLRQSGYEEFLTRGLLARAELRHFKGDRRGAEADFVEAEEIAERGGMRLHLCDVHLGWARLLLEAGEKAAAGRRLAAARSLVTATGYGRRAAELEALSETSR